MPKELKRTGNRMWKGEQGARNFLSSRGIPDRYLDAALVDFDNQYTFRDDKGQPKSFYIHGSAGCGKTHLLCAMLRETSFGAGSMFVTCDEMLWKLKDSFDAPRKRRFQNEDDYDDEESRSDAILTRYMEIDILGIDEFMMEKITDWSRTIITRIINHRYNYLLQTFIASNLSLDQMSEADDRIASRIAQMCEVIKLVGRDRRI
jgi:DNA replication protein DnaC